MRKTFSLPVLILSAFLLSWSPVFGQSSFSFGFTIGDALTGMSSHLASLQGGNTGYTYSGKSLTFLGLVANIKASDQIRIQPELLIQLVGTKVTEEDYGYYSVEVAYVKIPIDVLYRIKAGPGDFQAGLGPYFAKALLGKANGKSMDFGNNPDNDDLRGGDYGLDLRAEYIFNMSVGLFVSLNYDAGMENLIPGGSANGTDHDHAFGIAVGILFGYKGKK